MQSQKNGYTVLVGDDEMEARAHLAMALQYLGYSVEIAHNGDEVLTCLDRSRVGFAAVLLDFMMPRRDGIRVIDEIRRMDAGLPVIVISGASTTLNVVAAMKAGATDFLCKPVSQDDLRKALARALEQGTKVEAATPAKPLASNAGIFLGTNLRMREIQSSVSDVGWSDVPVLIQGETGTGKEILARELHANSRRAGQAFLKLNCAALPPELVESELFGYERGAFTGALRRKTGMFEAADHGTIFLDEIGDMDVRLQAKLLHVLQDHAFQRVGGMELIKVDVRVLAATHRDLEQALIDRTFREDLYYRLNVINIQLPPLRERKSDIVPLAEFLLGKHAGSAERVHMTPELKNAIMAHEWPGNIRELENVIRRLVVLRNPDLIVRELNAKAMRKPLKPVADAVTPPQSHHPAMQAPGNSSILQQATKAKQKAEIEAILAALNSTHWNRKQAAALLEIDYKALLYKMKKLRIQGDLVPFGPAPTKPAPLTLTASGG